MVSSEAPPLDYSLEDCFIITYTLLTDGAVFN